MATAAAAAAAAATSVSIAAAAVSGVSPNGTGWTLYEPKLA